jgi:ProP effector
MVFRSNCYNTRIFLVVDCIMGFEQLAALKDQLAKQAEEKRVARQAKQAKPARPAKQADAAKPARQTDAAKHAKPGRTAPTAARTAPAQKSKPVDPVVLSIGKLQKRFPKAFPKNPAPKVPLKVGIFKDLLEHSAELGLDEAALREAIKVWCWGSRYWACVVDNAMRVDLNGQDAGQVLPAEAARARGLQAKRQKTKNAAQGGTAQQGGAAAQEGAAQQAVVAEQDGAAKQAAVAQEGDAAQASAVQQEQAAQQDSTAEQNAAPQQEAQQDSAAQ